MCVCAQVIAPGVTDVSTVTITDRVLLVVEVF